jgi:hypothetical protein
MNAPSTANTATNTTKYTRPSQENLDQLRNLWDKAMSLANPDLPNSQVNLLRDLVKTHIEAISATKEVYPQKRIPQRKGVQSRSNSRISPSL